MSTKTGKGPSSGRTSTTKAVRKEAARKAAARKRRNRVAVITAGVAIFAIIVVFAVIDATDQGAAGVADANSFDLPALNADTADLPDAAVSDADDDGGARVRIADYAGTPTVVNFFASWCVACDDELPEFREAGSSLAGEIDFVFVNANEDGNWRPMAERNDILGFPIGKDVGANNNGLYRSLNGTGGMPITAFYDADGRLVDVAYGALLGGALEQRIATVFGITT